MKNSDKITLTVKQLKQLIKESRDEPLLEVFDDYDNEEDFDSMSKITICNKATSELRQIINALQMVIKKYSFNGDFRRDIGNAINKIAIAIENVGCS